MKTLSLIVMLLLPPGGERERGLEHYRAGRYQEAQLEFQAAVDAAPESAELQWNLALAAWRAGDLATAELAADKYAALDKDAKVELHRGLLGAIRYAEAERLEAQADAVLAAPPPSSGADEESAQPMPLLERALQKAQQSKLHFVRAVRAEATAEGQRNVERAARKVEELKKRLEELSKQQEQQEQQDGEKKPDPQQQDEKKDDQKQDGEKQDEKGDDQQQGDDQKSDEQKSDEQKKDEQQKGESGEQEPEQKPEQPQNQEGETPEPDPGEQEQQPGEPKPPEPKPESPPQDPQQQAQQGLGDQQEQTEQQPRGDAPGEQVGERELTPEQEQRVLEHLRDLERQLQELRDRLKRGRRPVERDW